MTNSINKGKSAERRAARFLRSLGFAAAARGQQHKGGPESPDVVGIPGIHFEVKDSMEVRLGTKALDQAVRQSQSEAANTEWPVVLWWEARKGWRLSWAHNGGLTIVTVATDADIARVIRAEVSK